VFTNAPKWVLGHTKKHRHAVIVLDREFGTAYDAVFLHDDLVKRIAQTGWPLDRFEVVVIDPEIEAWIWQQNKRVADALHAKSMAEVTAILAAAGYAWTSTVPKLAPNRPKEALEAVLRHKQLRWSSAYHKKITESIPVAKCSEPTFVELRNTLQRWFPPGATA
jgi:hypothetical protein